MPFNKYIIIVEKCSSDLADYLYHNVVFVSGDSKKIKNFINQIKPKKYFSHMKSTEMYFKTPVNEINKNEFYSKLYNLLEDKEICLYALTVDGDDLMGSNSIMEYFMIYAFKTD